MNSHQPSPDLRRKAILSSDDKLLNFPVQRFGKHVRIAQVQEIFAILVLVRAPPSSSSWKGCEAEDLLGADGFIFGSDVDVVSE